MGFAVAGCVSRVGELLAARCRHLRVWPLLFGQQLTHPEPEVGQAPRDLRLGNVQLLDALRPNDDHRSRQKGGRLWIEDGGLAADVFFDEEADAPYRALPPGPPHRPPPP